MFVYLCTENPQIGDLNFFEMNNYFICIKLPNNVVATAFSLSAQINGFSRSLIVPLDNFHITLKFLGGMLTQKQIETAKQNLKFIKIKPFQVRLRGMIAFPSVNLARVIGIGVEKSPELLELRKQIDRILPPLPLADNREYVPHLTLARIKTITDKKGLFRFFEKYKEIDFGSFEVKEFYFIKSNVTRKGSEYEVLAKYEL